MGSSQGSFLLFLFLSTCQGRSRFLLTKGVRSALRVGSLFGKAEGLRPVFPAQASSNPHTEEAGRLPFPSPMFSWATQGLPTWERSGFCNQAAYSGCGSRLTSCATWGSLPNLSEQGCLSGESFPGLCRGPHCLCLQERPDK